MGVGLGLRSEVNSLPEAGERNTVRGKLTELAKREAEVCQVVFEKEKELTDRALKLAEVGKPKSNWEPQVSLGLAVFVLGFLAGK